MEEAKTQAPKSGWMKTLGVIAGILMSILGILLFIKPVATTAVVIWLSFVGLLINGIVEIVKYCKTPKEERAGADLAVAILWIIIAIIMFLYGINVEFATASIAVVLAVMLGVTLIIAGIGNICTCGKHKSAPLAIIGGILQILCGIAVLAQPMFGLLTFAVVFGIYLLVMGIVFIVNTLTDNN